MLFDLPNTAATFQGLMNAVFKEQLRKFLVMFFDGILVHSKNLTQHLKHLKVRIGLLRTNSLFAKFSKYNFGGSRVEYLGHVVTRFRVSTGPSKISSIKE